MHFVIPIVYAVTLNSLGLGKQFSVDVIIKRTASPMVNINTKLFATLSSYFLKFQDYLRKPKIPGIHNVVAGK